MVNQLGASLHLLYRDVAYTSHALHSRVSYVPVRDIVTMRDMFEVGENITNEMFGRCAKPSQIEEVK